MIQPREKWPIIVNEMWWMDDATTNYFTHTVADELAADIVIMSVFDQDELNKIQLKMEECGWTIVITTQSEPHVIACSRDITVIGHDDGKIIWLVVNNYGLIISPFNRIGAYGEVIVSHPEVHPGLHFRGYKCERYSFTLHDVIDGIEIYNSNISAYSGNDDIRIPILIKRSSHDAHYVCENYLQVHPTCGRKHHGWWYEEGGYVVHLQDNFALDVYRGVVVDTLWSEYRSNIDNMILKAAIIGAINILNYDIVRVIGALLCEFVARPQIK